MSRSARWAGAVALSSVLAAGCGLLHRGPGPDGIEEPRFDEPAFARKPVETYRLRLPRGGAPPAETVVGAVRYHRIRGDETLLQVARYHGLGVNEIVEANPGIDPWVPSAGADVLLPTKWVLPCCTYQGIVVNIPEMRLYYFRRDPTDATTILLTTHPVGLGRDDRRTPRGTFRVSGKTVNPRWIIPDSIRQEHLRERGDGRRSIAGGAPDNPLGKYRIELTRPRYAIHGTNNPWGIGMQVTHGCVRLYPEDIERLFPLVPVGTRVEFTYQPVKIGSRGGALWIEVHRDIYRHGPSLAAATRAALARHRGASRVERRLVDAALERAAGVPVAVSAGETVARGGS